MNEAKRLLRAAQREGIRMDVYYPGESPDYVGTNAAEAWNAASACGLMHVSFHNVGGE